MTAICQRQVAQLMRILKEDLPEDLRHYKDTGDDSDLIDQNITAIINILEAGATTSTVIHCKSCAHAFRSRRSSTGLRCSAWGVEDFACNCTPDGFCHKAKIRIGADMIFRPRTMDYLPARAGQVVRVTEELVSSAGGRRYEICFYQKDGYLTDAYEDELEEV